MLEGHYARGEYEALRIKYLETLEALHQERALTAHYRQAFEVAQRKADAYLRGMNAEAAKRLCKEPLVGNGSSDTSGESKGPGTGSQVA